MISCPNKRLKSWKDLVSTVGELDALALWNQYQGNIPKGYYIKKDSESAVSSADSLTSSAASIPDFNNLIDDNVESVFDEISNETNPSTKKYQSNELLFGNKSAISVSEVLENISANFEDINDATKELILRSKKLLGKTDSVIKFVLESELEDNNTVMQYESDNNEIQISKARLEKFNEQDAVIAFLHEVVHGQTVQAVLKKPSERTFAEQELVDVVTNFMNKYKGNKRLSQYQGFNFGKGVDEVGIAEFIAEFYANPEFRNAIKEESDSVWKEILNAIRRIFDMSANPEYKRLFETIINYTEKSHLDYDGIKRYGMIFKKEAEEKQPIVKPTLVTYGDNLNYTVRKAQDNITQVKARIKGAKASKNKAENRKHMANIDLLLKQMEDVEEDQKLLVVLQYAKALAKTIAQVEKGRDRLYKTTKDFKAQDILGKINAYEDYLASYDLIEEIGDLLARSRREKLSEGDAKVIEEIRSTLAYAEVAHPRLIREFSDLKREQATRILADPKFNTQVETDHRNRLYKEYVDLKITGESKIEYANRMLNTRDKELYQKDLIASAEKITHDPSFDISMFQEKLGDSLNVNSRLIQIVVNIANSVRDTILIQYNDFNFKLDNLFKDVIKDKGSQPPSKMYKNIYEQDKNGNYFVKGKYKIEFRDKYLEEYIPIKDALADISLKLKGEGLTKLEMRSVPEYMEVYEKERSWLKENTVKDDTDQSGKRWYPNKSYLHEPLKGIDREIQKQFIETWKFSHKSTSGRQSLIRRAGQAEFYKFASLTKSNLERAIELDGKGIISDIKSDLTEIRPDDIGFGEAVSSKTGDVIKSVKIHFRGDLKPDQQSLDLMTMMRKEHLNALNYKEKSKAETNLLLLADISKNKKYYKTSSKTGGILSNIFNKNEPAVLIPGETSKEYARIKGLLDRNIYDTMQEHGGTFLGMDVNKFTNYINGTTAAVAMSFNLASGTANVFNGFSQLFIESFGGDVFKTKSLLKAEKKYTMDLPDIMADLSNPVKKSFTNQVLQMYDVFGGFDPATQDFIKNSIAKKLASKDTFNGLNEMGEHAMNSIITMSVLDSLKVMNSNHKYIDAKGNEVSEDKAASLLDMLKKDGNGKVVMDDKVKFTKHNLTTEYNEGGKVHINLLIKKKAFDLFGVYDASFKNELSKHWLGKSVMMFKNFFLSGMQYRYTGIDKSWTNRADLTEDDLNYNSAQKEYTEGTYTSLVRYFKEGVIPGLKSLQLAHMKEIYDTLSDHEKANLKKATIELVMTSVLLPMIGMLIAGAAGDDDDELWFLIYQFRRLESELSQFRNPIESTKLVTNPVAGVKLLQNALNLTYEVLTPLDFVPGDKENVFSYLNENSEGDNILLKKTKKVLPIFSQFNDQGFLGKNYKELHSLIDK